MTTTPENTESGGMVLLQVAKIAAWLFGLLIVFALALVGYEQLDLNGYIHHERTLDVYMANDWLVGENRECTLNLWHDKNGKATGQLDGLVCPAGQGTLNPHNLSVTFKGVVDPKDMNGQERSIPDEWRCTRKSGSFTCEAMDTSGKPSTP
jgi:hypothetical protein